MRAFLGLPAPEPLIPALQAVQGAIPVGRAVPEENLHLTLAFLGDIDDRQAEELHAALEARRLAPCEIALDGLATYGGRVPRLLAAEVRPAPALRDLQRAVAAAVRAAGLVLPRERFRPHITLVRFGSGLPERQRGALDRAVAEAPSPTGAARALQAVFYRSELTPGGAIYEPLAAYPLR